MGTQIAVRSASTVTKEDFPTTQFAGPRFQLAVSLVALLILFLRRPDALVNAQFYAEDGARWFADAYHVGWRCLLVPDSGYLQTVSRLIGLLCQLVPFSIVPLVMNLFAFFFQILPVNIFLSQRFAKTPLEIRVLSSLLYLSIPNSFETHANTTNIQWHLALACFLLLSQAAKSPLRYFEWLLLALSVLDGPAGMLLLPVAATLWWLRRDEHSRTALAILLPGCFLQTLVLLLSQSRRPATNGATLTRFVEIAGGQVFLSSVLGLRTSIQLFFAHVGWLPVAQAIALVIGLIILSYALWRGPLSLKLFISYSYLSLTLALTRPVASFSAEHQQWELMLTPGVANRYYFLPMLAFFAALIWIAAYAAPGRNFPRYLAIAVLALLPIGVVRDWRYKPFVDYDFKAFATDFDGAAPGTTVSIPINPDWQLVLLKH